MIGGEQGALLLEVLIAAALIALGGIGLISSAHVSTEAARRTRHLLTPECIRPACSELGTLTRCTCGQQSVTVLR